MPLFFAGAVVALLFVGGTRAAGTRAEVAARHGGVVSVRGGIFERRTGETWRTITTGDRISFGEKLRTSRNTVAVLYLPGQGRFVVGPGSEITLGADAAASRTRLDRGAVWVHAALEPGRTMSVATPSAVAGVRGTRFSVLTDTEGSAFCTCTGRVDVELGDSRIITSRTGQFVPVENSAPKPSMARSDRALLARVRGDRYDWCFTCHEVGGRGRLKRGWT